ncbi:high-affinity methionine permease [Monosporozyma unispora]|nr:methionine permease [Kazachstania unispora]
MVKNYLSEININNPFRKNTVQVDEDSINDSTSLEVETENNDNVYTNIDKGKKQVGLISCVGLVVNRMLGAGIFAVPSTIYTLCGSIGLSLIIWAVGAIIALSGLYVYMEFGTAIPKNGGEKNYLEFIFKKPKFFATSMYASYVFFMGWAAGNSVNTAVMFLTAGEAKITEWNQRGLGVAIIAFAFIVNSVSVKYGLYLQNLLGIFKLGIVVFISITGWVALGGGLKGGYQSHNFHNAFEGTTKATAYGIVTALYNVIWSFIGYSNINYALGEVKDPARTLKIAGPSSLIVLAIIYMFVNIAFFAVVPKDKLISSKLILVADFFDIVFGGHAKRAASAFVGLSALGNVLSVIFAQGRVIQQLGREGVLPFSNFFASSKPFNSPMIGLFQHFIICIITILAPPPGDAYNFIMNLVSYPLNIINFCISLGLLWIYWEKRQGRMEWDPPLKAGVPVIVFFTLANLYLIVAPYIPPSDGESVYETLPYWIHCVVTWGVFGIGAAYYLLWAHILPWRGGYTLVNKEIVGEDGFWRNKIIKVYPGDEDDITNVTSADTVESLSDSVIEEKVSNNPKVGFPLVTI